MNILKQITIIMFVTLIGVILNKLIPLPIPASIYGLVIMFLILWFGWLKVESVRSVSIFLIEIMPLMFISPSVMLIKTWPTVKPFALSAVIICCLSTVIVMIFSGKITQILLDKKHKPLDPTFDEGYGDDLELEIEEYE